MKDEARHTFLVIEGCNGAGKSTIVEYLCARASAISFHYPPEFVRFRREVRMDESLAALPRLAYYLAATMHLSDLVGAQLQQSDVICDRYLASPLSLLLAEAAIEESAARKLVEPFESYLLRPSVTLLLTVGHAVASARIKERALKSGNLTPVAQKMVESPDFFRRRQDVSRRIAMSLGPMVELETTDLTPQEMCSSAWNLVAGNCNWK